MAKKIKIGIPKGSLEAKTKELFKKAGYNIKGTERSYFPSVDDDQIEAMLIRSQEMSRYVEQGTLDIGICGSDWVAENDSDVITLSELVYAKVGRKKVKWVLAVPNNSKIRSVKDLEGKHVATELVKASEKYLKKNGVKAKVEFSWGATEAKPPELADAIIEITETGSSLKANNLKIIDTILESTTVVIANKDAVKDAWKKEKIDNITLLLKGALMAEEMVGLKMNVPKNKLDSVLKVLPALKKPTVAPLTDDKWVDVDTIIEEKVVREIIPKLKKAGASGIVEYPLNKVIPD